MSTDYCKYTCPDVDAKMEDMISEVFTTISEIEIDQGTLDAIEAVMRQSCETMKEVGTYKLRSALDSCYSDLLDERERVKELEDELSEKDSEISKLNDDISNLQDEVDHLNYRLDE